MLDGDSDAGRRTVCDSASWAAKFDEAEHNDTPVKAEDFVVIDNAYRMVVPYFFDFACSVKQRWVGTNIIDFFCTIFPARTREYYLQALADGRLRVEGAPHQGPEDPLPSNSRIRHFVHRHEPAVPATDVAVVGLTPDLVAVNKPSGMPVHVAGQFRKNTVMGVLLAARPDLAPLLPAHRLDKPVSGVLLFARNPAAAERLRQLIEGHQVQKVYVARVQGVFPAAGPDGQPTIVADAALAWDAGTNMACVVPADELQGDAAGPAVAAAETGATTAAEIAAGPEGAEHAAAALPAVGDGGGSAGPGADADEDEGMSRQKKRKKLRASKAERMAAYQRAGAAATARNGRTQARHAVTNFRLLGVAPDGLTSLVECRPLTGRPHQIRVHLASLGHPVANDRQYGGRYDGPISARALATQLGVSWPDPGQAGGGAVSSGGNGGEHANGSAAAQYSAQGAVAAAVQDATSSGAADPAAALEATASALLRSGEQLKILEHLRDPYCPHCPYYAPCDYPVDLRPLWLHARTYSCAEWAFTAEPPAWAAPGWTSPPPPDAAAA